MFYRDGVVRGSHVFCSMNKHGVKVLVSRLFTIFMEWRRRSAGDYFPTSFQPFYFFSPERYHITTNMMHIRTPLLDSVHNFFGNRLLHWH